MTENFQETVSIDLSSVEDIEEQVSANVDAEVEVLEALLAEKLKLIDELETEDLRPALTIKEAAQVLGKSVRALERSLVGKWGNKLPEGWSARKIRIDNKEEWRVIPPASFKVKPQTAEEAKERIEEDSWIKEALRFGSQFALERTARGPRTLPVVTSEGDAHPTIIIDRTDEVETLLREVVEAHKALAEERKQHVEDLRLLNQMQGSMRLLESNAGETTRLKNELLEAQKDLLILKTQYQDYLKLPWWKRIFRRFP